jgi:predicted nucleotidyltransferase component of viral defense system
MAQNERSILSSHQRKFLALISKEQYFTQRYYLTGGTALAEFYLRHRISEDLDFFSEYQEVNQIPVTSFLKEKSKNLEVAKYDTRRVMGLYSYFLHFQDNAILKIDFNYYPFPRIEKGKKFGKLEINSIYDIGVDKVHTVVLQPRARDFIDIYFIIKEKNYDFYDLLMKAKAKFDWDITALELGTRLIEASELTDYPRMLKKIDHREWKDFFLKEAKKLKKEIFK